jgi:RNAse (barnase) inhibitor barstar
MICYIDCSDIQNAGQLHRKMARLLAFPEWYGHNLDALYDCLTELPSFTRLYLDNWNSSSLRGSGFEAVLNDAQASCPDLAVIFE